MRDERQRRRYDREIAAGRPLWTVRPYGYKKNGMTLKSKEAAIIREAVEAYLDGKKSMIQIAHDWTERGILTDGMQRKRVGKDGKKKMPRQYWTASTVRQVLLRPRNAGILVHRGVVQPKSKIEAIITPEQHQKLKDRATVGTKKGARAMSLMGGIIRCQCGAPMHSTISYSKRKNGPRYEYRNYKCSQLLYDKTQSHAAIEQTSVDSLFTSFLLLDLFTGALKVPEGTNLTDGIRALAEALQSLRENLSYQEERLANPALKKMHPRLEAEWVKLQAEEEELLAQRDILLASASEFGGLEAFMAEWRDGPEGFSSREDFDAWQEEFWRVWNSVSIQNKQALITLRYRPVVKVGGRGIGRVSLNPRDAQ